MRGQPGFFDVDERLKRLSDLGDELETYAGTVDFEMFRPELDMALAYSDGADGGRPPYDPVMMFKILVVQAHNNLSDERSEFLINDRLSFMRFLGLGLGDRVPDARTIWSFRERLVKAKAIERLFVRFDQAVRAAGYIPMSGQIVDASLVAAPKQRNSEEEKQAIKAGRIPEEWKDKPAKLRHKDRDARWTVKYTKAKPRKDGSLPAVDIAIPLLGYQNHISIDRGFGFIRKWAASDAAAYAGRLLRHGLLDKTNTAGGVWADTGYRSQKNEKFIARTLPAMFTPRNPRANRCRKRCAEPTTPNRRSAPRVEHVFAEQKDRMHLFIRTIGIDRATIKIGLTNLVYNIKRLIFLRRTGLA